MLRGLIALFIEVARKGGVLLLGALAIALLWKNADADSYDALWSGPVLTVINDGLMAVFFFVVGAEIKRELVVGELQGRRALVPALAALGGMIAPALLYLLVAPTERAGFGTPMATDIAFALAAITTLGKRVPDFVVKVLLGLAIIDDLGAIVVIAVFYGAEVDAVPLLIAGGVTLALFIANRAGVRALWPYLVAGAPLWWLLHDGGVHPTIAGVVVAMTLPADALERPVRALSPLIHWLILPVFALANGGVDVSGFSSSSVFSPVALGIIVGLVVGKQLGIFLTCVACVQSKLLPLPAGVRFGHLWGMAILGGVGFTMSLFVAGLAFTEGSQQHTQAKAGILIGSSLSALLGVLVLRLLPPASVEESA